MEIQGQSTKILIVDDEQTILNTCSMALKMMGYEVVTEVDAEHALDRLKQEYFDLLLTDIQMGEMSGIDLLRMLKEIDAEFPVIIMTGQASLDNAIESLREGALEYIRKPFGPIELQPIVERVLEKQRIMKENARLKALVNLFDVNQAIAATMDVEPLLQKSLAAAVQETDVAYGAVLLASKEEIPSLQIKAVIGFDKSSLANTVVMTGKSLCAQAYAEKRIITAKSKTMAEIFDADFPSTNIFQSCLCAPLLGKQAVQGVLVLLEKKRNLQFTEADIQVVSVLISQTAIALENIQLINKVQQDERIRSNLQRYLSPSLVEEVITGERQLSLGGKLETVTILIPDIRNFTTLSEQIPPFVLVNLLNKFFTEMAEVIFKYEGTVDKYAGDSIISLFGSPIKHDDDSARAILAALEMQQRAAKLQRLWAEHGWDNFGFGIGINYGKVILGNIGSQQRMEYTVIGDEVNITDRLASIAKHGQILISQSVYDETKDLVKAQKIPQVTLKGKDKPVDVYAVLGLT